MFSGWGSSPKDDNPGEKALATELSKPAVDPTSQKKGTSSSTSVSGFDPTALERAAKAARELDRSSNAKDSLRLINTQEITKQKEHEAERAKYQAYQQELAIKRIAEEEVSAQRVLQKQTEQARAQANYKDDLDRKRMQEKMRSQRALADEERQKTEESLRRQEELKRKTLEYEAALRQQTEIARVKAEAEGRILQERQNHDLFLENRKLDALQYRETILESIKLGGSTLYGGLQAFIQDRQKLTNTALTISGIALGIYSARMGTSIAGKYIEARLGKPSLVRETSKKNIMQMVRSPLSSFKQAFGSVNVEGALKNVILESNLEQRLSRVSVSTANTKINRAPFRHLLLHGPPGTGKTMFAKGLAKECGLHYAIMTGGDVAPLGKDAVTEIHKLFDWANTTNKGVLLFIDEADAFLRKRSTERISEDMRNALNAFLYRTGEASHKFMIVYASNQPEQFDWAINDRIDEMVEFRLPSLEERLRMIVQYMDIYLLHPPAGSKQIIVDGVDEALLRSFAVATDGFSGREISKLAIAWQAAAYGTPNATIDKELLSEVLRDSLNSKQQKRSWASPLDLERLTTDASNAVVVSR